MNVLDALFPLAGDGAAPGSWPRPDFRVAALEFGIGIVAVARPPADLHAWLEDWRTPPSSEEVARFLEPYRRAFELDGTDARFMQDREDLPGQSDPPETLLIEAPGESTIRNNTALLVKPGRVRVLSRRAAAAALDTLQTYAPAGGRGNLTSLRGGGPLTTLVLPPSSGDPWRDRWRLIWANVPYGKPVPPDALATVFPWCAPTRTADRYTATTDADVHPLQAFFGMPRRIRLDFAANAKRLPCDLTGEIDDIIVTGWRQRPNGTKYVGFVHPLSPYYDDGKSGKLPLHPQPGGIGYRHWLGLAFGTSDGSRQRAACVATWYERARELPAKTLHGTRLLAAGFDMDNMKARSFFESEMPLPGSGDEAAEKRVREIAQTLVPASEVVARCLRLAVRNALLGNDAKTDGTLPASAGEELWSATQDQFFGCLERHEELPLADMASAWRLTLQRVALRVFDAVAPLDPRAASFDFARVVDARKSLSAALNGYGKSGGELFKALHLPLPEQRKSKARGNPAA